MLRITNVLGIHRYTELFRSEDEMNKKNETYKNLSNKEHEEP